MPKVPKCVASDDVPTTLPDEVECRVCGHGIKFRACDMKLEAKGVFVVGCSCQVDNEALKKKHKPWHLAWWLQKDGKSEWVLPGLFQ